MVFNNRVSFLKLTTAHFTAGFAPFCELVEMPVIKDDELEILKAELEMIIDKVKEAQKKVKDKNLEEICSNVAEVGRVGLRTKRYLKGHISKVNAVHFSADNRHLVSGALDGKLIIWDTWTGNKVQVVPLRSSWVMAASFAPSGNLVACGGMDNVCTVYDVTTRDQNGVVKIVKELAGMEGFLSCCRFLDDSTIITGSADTKICKWDLARGTKEHEFIGHGGDIICMSLAPDGNTFITGSVDDSVKLWDIRDGQCKHTFWGHESDVNSVYFHSSGFYFGTASDDKTARLFDIRGDQEVAVYTVPSAKGNFSSCALSKSGRFIICGSDDFNIHVWDTLKAQYNCALAGHENRVTSIDLSENGIALASGSWDTAVRIWT